MEQENCNIFFNRSSRDRRKREYDDHDHKSRSYSGTRERKKKSRWDEETDDLEHRRARSPLRDRDGRMTRTLDGKIAGLQDARALQEETKAHKQREIEQFNKVIFFITRLRYMISNYVILFVHGDVNASNKQASKSCFS